MTAIFNSHLMMIVIVAVVAIVGIVSVKFLGPDNPVEKVAEQVITEETGLNVNLTPNDTKVTPTIITPNSSAIQSTTNPTPTSTTSSQNTQNTP